MKTQTLYRPVGLSELILIHDSGWKAFPPRLAWQPIFYPVLNEAYAAQIAKDWNSRDQFSGYFGAVTAFSMQQDFIEKYPVQQVGSDIHDELWILAEELSLFNAHINGPIKVLSIYVGQSFIMPEHPALEHLIKYYKNEIQ